MPYYDVEFFEWYKGEYSNRVLEPRSYRELQARNAIAKTRIQVQCEELFRLRKLIAEKNQQLRDARKELKRHLKVLV